MNEQFFQPGTSSSLTHWICATLYFHYWTSELKDFHEGGPTNATYDVAIYLLGGDSVSVDNYHYLSITNN